MVQDISQQLVALNQLKVARQENFATMEINQVRAPHRFSHPLGPHAISPHQAIVELGYAPLDVAAMEKKSVEVELRALLEAHCLRFRVLVHGSPGHWVAGVVVPGKDIEAEWH